MKFNNLSLEQKNKLKVLISRLNHIGEIQKKKGKFTILILFGSTGSGKDTILNELLSILLKYNYSILNNTNSKFTTRKKRPQELSSYLNFIEEKDFMTESFSFKYEIWGNNYGISSDIILKELKNTNIGIVFDTSNMNDVYAYFLSLHKKFNYVMKPVLVYIDIDTKTNIRNLKKRKGSPGELEKRIEMLKSSDIYVLPFKNKKNFIRIKKDIDEVFSINQKNFNNNVLDTLEFFIDRLESEM